ncbi:MAG: MFS transporter [Streptosporangiales bacterium]|nr:MFS transporter [Streptosporangiales bacterium]
MTEATGVFRPERGEASGRSAEGRAAATGAFFTEFVDMFDIYLPTVVLTPALLFFQPGHLSQGLAGIFTSLVFVTTLIGRPVGAAVFGAVGDRVGRRRATILSVSGFAVITLLIAVLPGYSTIGVPAYWLLIILRFLDGVCLGGGYTGSHPLAMEYSPARRRGLLGGVILAAFPAAYVLITLLALVCLAVFPLAGAGSAYAVWGWRIPFVVGAVLGAALVVYYVKRVPESRMWERTETRKSPLANLFKGQALRNLAQVFVLMTGFWLTQNMITLYLPTTVLGDFLHLGHDQLTVTVLIAYACLIFSYIAAGVLGQKYGRRRFMIVTGVLIAIIGTALLAVLVTASVRSLAAVIVVTCLLAILVTAPWGVFLSYINERFTTDVRASGFGLGFSASVVIPSFYAFFMDWLGHVMPYHLTGLVLLFIGAILGTVGAVAGPDTRHVDLSRTELAS